MLTSQPCQSDDDKVRAEWLHELLENLSKINKIWNIFCNIPLYAGPQVQRWGDRLASRLDRLTPEKKHHYPLHRCSRWRKEKYLSPAGNRTADGAAHSPVNTLTAVCAHPHCRCEGILTATRWRGIRQCGNVTCHRLTLKVGKPFNRQQCHQAVCVCSMWHADSRTGKLTYAMCAVNLRYLPLSPSTGEND